MKQRLDQKLVELDLVATRSQAESFVKLAQVTVDGRVIKKAGYLVDENNKVRLTAKEQYVSRAGLKLASVVETLKLNFSGKVVLDVGSSTGGFTDYALQHGADRVIAVELGRDQLHPSLRSDERIELHEQTDILSVKQLSQPVDVVVADVSFISLREILPHVAGLVGKRAQLVMMVKPQFETIASNLKHKGVIKNDKMRRQILKDFEDWARREFIIIEKSDSAVAGAKGNRERFYLLKKA